jgi:hypothetical protein
LVRNPLNNDRGEQIFAMSDKHNEGIVFINPQDGTPESSIRFDQLDLTAFYNTKLLISDCGFLPDCGQPAGPPARAASYCKSSFNKSPALTSN